MAIGTKARRRFMEIVRSVGRRLARAGLGRTDEWMLTGEVCGSVLVPRRLGPVGQVTVYVDHAGRSGDGSLCVSFGSGELSETAIDRLVEVLAGMEGVVPADLPVDGRCVDVAALAPAADEHGLRWRISEHLWLEEGAEPRLVTDLPRGDDGGWSVDLAGPEEAWDLLRALRTNESWLSGLAPTVDEVAPRRRRALAALIARRG